MSVYSNKFYDAIRAGCVSSANTVVPVVYEVFQPKTVVDIGCGEGHWAKAFEDLGATVVGVDGDYVSEPVVDFVPANLAKGLPLDKLSTYDLAVSLEVAEHLPASRADGFVDELCQLAPNILFSAAIPGQGGVDHINEQWAAYWIEKFARHGYEVSDCLRWIFWESEAVEWWYRQNLLVFSSAPSEYPTFFTQEIRPLEVIHPILWESRL